MCTYIKIFCYLITGCQKRGAENAGQENGQEFYREENGGQQHSTNAV